MTEPDSSTASALLDAAEIEFATTGVDGASLRSIMRAAGANTAAIHYHYGSREALTTAVLDRVLVPLNDRRIDLLDEIGEEPPLDELLTALIRPDLEAVRALADRNPAALRLLGIIYGQPNRFVKSHVEDRFRPVAERYMPPLMAVLTHLDPAEIAWRIRWCVFGVLGGLLSADADDYAADSAIDLADLDRSSARVVAFCAAGLAADAPSEPGANP